MGRFLTMQDKAKIIIEYLANASLKTCETREEMHTRAVMDALDKIEELQPTRTLEEVHGIAERVREKAGKTESRFKSRLEDLKPGDVVFCVNDKEKDFNGYFFMSVCNGYAIVCVGYMELLEDFDGQLAEMCEESLEKSGLDWNVVKMYPIDKVFLTDRKAMAYLRNNVHVN